MTNVRAVPGYSNIFVCGAGLVHRKMRTGRVRVSAGHIASYGYRKVRIDGKLVAVHRLVALAFHGAPPSGHKLVRHLNNDKTDNRPSNLCWGTAASNGMDDRLTGIRRGERNGSARLTDAAVLNIREMRERGMTYQAIAAHHNVSFSTVRNVSLGYKWSHVRPPSIPSSSVA